MNSVILIGNLTKDPELRYNGENPICRFTLAVNDRKKQGSEWVDDPSFIPIVVFGRVAENCDRFLSKGRKVAVSGRIKTGSYTKQDGTKVYTTDVIANGVEFLNTNEAKSTPVPRQEEPQYVTRQQYQEERQQGMFTDPYKEPPNGFAKIDEDIPF